MQLTTWPITDDQTGMLHYDGGSPVEFLFGILDDVGDRLQLNTDGSNLAPDLLDPFVFAQFVTGLEGHYTVNGSPFAGNWRLLPAAKRMAGRLGASALEAELAQAEDALKEYDPALLDSYDGLEGWKSFDAQPQDMKDKLFWLLDQRFQPLVGAGDCTYGTSRETHEGGDKLLASLCDWMMQDFPREVLANREAVNAKIAANHNWACDNVENYEREFARFYVGQEVYEMLKGLGLRYARGGRGPAEPHMQQVIAYEVRTAQGDDLIRFNFGDGIILADAQSLQERARNIQFAPPNRPDHLPPYLNIADTPKVALNRKDMTTFTPSLFRRSKDTLKYAQ